ncbi:fibronectin type III domain-containing protein [Rhodococcus zopfii]
MSYPVGGAPDGSWKIGTVGEPQGYNESGVKSMIRGQNLGPWGNAQTQLHGEFISAPLFGGEVARLDNRIDELVIGSERAFRYTYSESDVWTKHPAGYRVDVDIFSGATCGVGTNGGYAGGWERFTFQGEALADLPSSVAVTIGAGTEAGSTSQAGTSSFGTFASVSGATTTAYGPGSRTYKMRGGDGGATFGAPGTAGSDGPFTDGGSGGLGGNPGGDGGNGFSIGVGMVGPGAAGGGGGASNAAFLYRGGHGGHGGWPSAPGGGAGHGGAAGAVPGNGAAGMVVVTVYVADDFGIPPSTPTGLVASSVTASSAHVAWDASVDDVMVKHYILYLNGSRYGVINALYHDLVGLAASTSYSVRIQAVDIGDNVSELSAVLNFTTTA